MFAFLAKSQAPLRCILDLFVIFIDRIFHWTCCLFDLTSDKWKIMDGWIVDIKSLKKCLIFFCFLTKYFFMWYLSMYYNNWSVGKGHIWMYYHSSWVVVFVDAIVLLHHQGDFVPRFCLRPLHLRYKQHQGSTTIASCVCVGAKIKYMCWIISLQLSFCKLYFSTVCVIVQVFSRSSRESVHREAVRLWCSFRAVFKKSILMTD